MEPCKTPSFVQNIEFQYDHISTPKDSEEFVEKCDNFINADKFLVPHTMDFDSPGLSPIEFPELCDQARDKKDFFSFPLPKPIPKQMKKISPKTIQKQIADTEKQQQQQQQQFAENNNWNENLSFDLDLSTSSKVENSLEASSRSESSKISNVLNRTLNVTVLLKEIGLSHHSEIFAKKGIDLEKFLKLKINELENLGLQSDEDCKAIIAIVDELNSS